MYERFPNSELFSLEFSTLVVPTLLLNGFSTSISISPILRLFLAFNGGHFITLPTVFVESGYVEGV